MAFTCCERKPLPYDEGRDSWPARRYDYAGTGNMAIGAHVGIPESSAIP